MKKIALMILLMVAFNTGNAELISLESKHGVQETMDKFESIIKEKGMSVFARIDHHENAMSVDMEMGEAQLLIFGAPKGGTLLMQQDLSIAIELPLKVLVYKAAEDQPTMIAYKDPLKLGEAYALENTAILEKLSGGLAKMTAAAGK